MAEKPFTCWSGVGRLVGRRGCDVGLDEPTTPPPPHPGPKRRSVHLERVLEVLPEGAAGQGLREFWLTFVDLDLRPLLERRGWTRADLTVLDQLRKRCLSAARPFVLATQLLHEGWHEAGPQTPGPKGREAAAAALASQQWDLLLAVQGVLGRLDAPCPAWRDLRRETAERRERYLLQGRAFLLVAAALGRGAQPQVVGAVTLEDTCLAEVTLLLAVQYMVPDGWRRA